MRTTTKLLALAGLVAGIVAYQRKRRLRGSTRDARSFGARDVGATAPGVGVAPDVMIVEAEIVGIADVDPEDLTQPGEAIDPELVRAAHEEIPEQRDRLPVRGKNVP